jgi:hypothetical protein
MWVVWLVLQLNLTPPPFLTLFRFAEYRKDDPASFMLHQNLSYFPQFMFNLRRSQFVQVRLMMIAF